MDIFHPDNVVEVIRQMLAFFCLIRSATKITTITINKISTSFSPYMVNLLKF